MSTISASTTSTTAFKITTDTTGALVFQTGASPTTAMTLGSDQSVTFAGTPTYSSGTANGVAYLNASKVLTTGTALVFDGTNLGLGATPSAWYSSYKALQVKTSALAAWGNNEVYLMSNAYGDTSSTYKYLATGSKATSYVQYEGTHLWYTAGTGTAGGTISFTQAMTLDASGNLGIGSTAPSSDGASGYKNLVIGTSSGSAAGITMLTNNSGATTQGIIWARSAAAVNGFVKYDHYYDALTFGAAAAERARIDSNGNWLLGTTTTLTKATVYGTGDQKLSLVSPTGSSTQVGINLSPSMTAAEAAANPAQAAIYATDSSYSANIIFANKTAGALGNALTERARINTAGLFLAGTTSAVNSAHTFSVSQANSAFIVQNAGTGGIYGLQVRYSAADPNNTGSSYLELYSASSGVLRGEIRSNGGLANYSANNVNLSDRREKTNFAPAGDYLSKICAIPVQTFNYIDQNLEEDDGLTLGVVAQDVQAVAPELVMESNWGSRDAPKMRLSIYQTDLQYALMKAIQELNAKVVALENK